MIKQQRASYSPNGMVSNKPIGLRLSIDELNQVKNMAATENRSLASMTRILCMKGLEVINQEKQTA
ncbi:MAG: hypothetical protein Q7U16_03880 [Agitococcus sp.]|nr:hypothetical protein [Agitococcus sp.]